MDADLRGNMIMKEAFEMRLTGAQRLHKIQMNKRLMTEMKVAKFNYTSTSAHIKFCLYSSITLF